MYAAVVFTDPCTVFFGIVLQIEFIHAFGHIGLEGNAVLVFLPIHGAVQVNNITQVTGTETWANGYVLKGNSWLYFLVQ